MIKRSEFYHVVFDDCQRSIYFFAEQFKVNENSKNERASENDLSFGARFR